MGRAVVDSEGTRERLLRAAEALFAEKGYDDTSIRHITEAAEANVAAVHYHFGGKENLYLEVFRRHTDEMAAVRDQAARAATAQVGAQALHTVIRTYVCSLLRRILAGEEMACFARMAFREISSPGPAFDLLYREFIQPNHRALQAAILQALPEMSPRRATLCVVSVFGLMLHFVRARRVVGQLMDQPYDEALVDEICDHIVTFTTAGMGLS